MVKWCRMIVPRLSCSLFFQSTKTLEEVASLISVSIFGGIPFVGKDDHIRDEFPAVYLEHEVLGLWVVLAEGEEGTYQLSINTGNSFFLKSRLDILQSPKFDITEYVRELLKGVL